MKIFPLLEDYLKNYSINYNEMKVCKADWLESINVTDMDKLNTICVWKMWWFVIYPYNSREWKVLGHMNAKDIVHSECCRSTRSLKFEMPLLFLVWHSAFFLWGAELNMADVSMSGGTLLSQLAYSLGAPEPALRLLVSILLGNVKLQVCTVKLFVLACRIEVICK